jgi:RimJ/RimL family protein N-acetyltransferase
MQMETNQKRKPVSLQSPLADDNRYNHPKLRGAAVDSLHSMTKNIAELPLLDAGPAKRPERVVLQGRAVSIAPLDAEAHASALYEGSHGDGRESLWDYLFDGPFPDQAAFAASLKQKAASDDPLLFAIVENRTGIALGHASYLRIEPGHKVIEVGNILYTRALQRTFGATEAMYLMARHVFEDLGYRRYEWKCNALNAPSRRAALRLGFSFEGIFRQHMIVKGRNRDTAWFSMLDSEWTARKAAFERWLDPGNFDSQGRQKSGLGSAF